MEFTHGEALRSWRLTKKMTQKQVAKKLGVHQRTVSKWELNQARPDSSRYAKLQDLFGKTERTIKQTFKAK